MKAKIVYLSREHELELDGGLVTGLDIVKQLNCKGVLLMEVDGALWDLSRCVPENVSKVCMLNRQDKRILDVLRHNCAHLLAQAVMELFEGVQITIGPVIEDGFYYDFCYHKAFVQDDLQAIEMRMHQIIDRDLVICRSSCTRQQVSERFAAINQEYKLRILEDIPEDEELTVYQQGDWFDLCRGPHLPSTGDISHAFKLLSVAGSYWRGDSKAQKLQRIYGTCWWSEKDLRIHLKRLEEVEKRDHRKLGRQLGLFCIQHEISPGCVFWYPKGFVLLKTVEDYMRCKLAKHGYVEVRTPLVYKSALWHKSGHWDKFSEYMYTLSCAGKSASVDGKMSRHGNESTSEAAAAVGEAAVVVGGRGGGGHGGHGQQDVLKPMNCPGHIQLFNSQQYSYRQLPLRMAEFGCCHRAEPSGALHGLMRLKAFHQDDAHIFCTEQQIQSETASFCKLLKEVYRDFGFDHIEVRLSTRPERFVGSIDVWDEAEKQLEMALREMGMEYAVQPGEGAFYGPKIEFVLRDAINRRWQCGTLQLDFFLPRRLGAFYNDKESVKQHPVLLHRAVLGSLERFIGILIENYAGAFPVWLAPVQLVICSLTSGQAEYADGIYKRAVQMGLRAHLDNRSLTLSGKIREHSAMGVPVVFVVGQREHQDGTVMPRYLDDKSKNNVPLQSEQALRQVLDNSGHNV